MSKAFDKIMDGMGDALAFAEGDAKAGRARTIRVDVPDVKAIRESLHMSQARFAETFLLNADTVRQWEQGRRQPDQPARLLLHLIGRNPEGVAKELNSITPGDKA